MQKKTQTPILVVDDNPMNRKLLTSILAKKGYSTVALENGQQAVAAVRCTQFSLIFLDLLMPGMDGFEVVRVIRGLGLVTPVIAVSALSFRQDKQRALAAGFDAFIPKPIDANGIGKMLSRFIENPIVPIPAASAPECAAILLPLANVRVLLIDGDSERADRFSAILQKSGAVVDCVNNGSTALERIEKNERPVDVVVSSMFVEGIDALGLLVILKRLQPQVLMYIYPEHYDPRTFQTAMLHGAAGVLPVDEVDKFIVDMIQADLQKPKEHGGATSTQIICVQGQLINAESFNQVDYLDIAYSAFSDIGGDIARVRYFDGDRRVGIVLADVAGHDIVSSYTSATFLGILLSLWDDNQVPAQLLHAVNSELVKIGNQRSHVCMTAILWDRTTGVMDIATAGNPGALLVTYSEDGTWKQERLSGGGMVLGILDTADLYVHDSLCPSGPGSLFLHTDGIDSVRLCQVLTADCSLLSTVFENRRCAAVLGRIKESEAQLDDMMLVELKLDSPSNPVPIRNRFGSTFEDVDQACDWVSRTITNGMLTASDDYYMVMLAIREALLNAAEHGNLLKPEAEISVSINRINTGFVVQIRDRGCGFDLTRELEAQRELDGFQIGKRGLSVMSAAAAVDVSGNAVSLVFSHGTADRPLQG